MFNATLFTLVAVCVVQSFASIGEGLGRHKRSQRAIRRLLDGSDQRPWSDWEKR